MTGEVIAGKYHVIRELGEGSMGVVYLVKHADLGVHYALKLVKPSLSSDARFLDRFRREAEIILRFSHPGSVQLRDFGKTEDGRYYMATDFCTGESLENAFERETTFSLPYTLQVIIQILDVLDAAHSEDIIHRDIKSGNVMIEYGSGSRPRVRLLDFGIARIKDEMDVETRVTSAGASIGTPAYMSPEQAAGEQDLDQRADIYSTGIVMYEMISGQVPFVGRTVMQTLLKHLTQPVPPFSLELKVPPFVEAVVQKALAKEREQRYQTAVAFREDCKDALLRLESGREQMAPAPQQAAEPVEVKTPKKILCLDDNEMILQIVRHIFEHEGYHVFTASNFSVIHDYIFTHEVRVMLCDVNMPGLPGDKICRMLKQTTKNLKIVLFSNMPERDLEKLAQQCMADAWLSKSTRPDEWLAKVREIEETVAQK